MGEVCCITEKDELGTIDRKSWKLLTMYRLFDCKENADQLYFPWKIGAKGMISVEDCVNIEIANI